jgi:hypothetical protein
MKSLKPFLSLSLVILFIAANASASCPTIYLLGCCGTSYYTFNVDTSCITAQNLMTAQNNSCSMSGYSSDGGYSNYVEWTYVIPADGTPTANGHYFYQLSTNYSATVWVDFDSPDQTFYDSLSGTVTVTHNGTPTNYSILSLRGSSASTQICGRFDRNFTATNGDTIKLRINATKFGTGSTIVTSLPTVFNTH